MLSVLFRRATFTSQRVLLWAGPSHRCWISSLGGASPGGPGSPQTRWASSLSPYRERHHGPAVCFNRTESSWPQRTHPTAVSLKNRHFHSSAVRLKKRPKPEPPPRELDLLRYDMKDLGKTPKPALYLGLAGLIPFVCPTLFMGVTESYIPELAYAQVAYAASILSFLGGARWGFALPESSPAKPDWINLANSVVPSLFAWITMVMSDSIVSAATMVIMGLGVSLHYDLSLLPTYPSWLKALRAVLTIVAFFSLLGTIIVNNIYPEKKLF